MLFNWLLVWLFYARFILSLSLLFTHWGALHGGVILHYYPSGFWFGVERVRQTAFYKVYLSRSASLAEHEEY